MFAKDMTAFRYLLNSNNTFMVDLINYVSDLYNGTFSITLTAYYLWALATKH